MLVHQITPADVGKQIILPISRYRGLTPTFTDAPSTTTCTILSLYNDGYLNGVLCGWSEQESCASAYTHDQYERQYGDGKYEYFYVVYPHNEFKWATKEIINPDLKCSVCGGSAPHQSDLRSETKFVCLICVVCNSISLSI